MVVLKKLLPDVIHTHLLDRNVIGLSARRFLGIKKRLYTRHDSTIHHEYHKKGVLYDYLNNWNATHIIATYRNVYEVLTDLEGVSPKKVSIIYYGFDLNRFLNIEDDTVVKSK